MTEEAILNCKKREKHNKGYLKQKKREEWIPGIIYGRDMTPLPVFIGSRELARVFKKYGSRGLIHLHIEEKENPVLALVREVQRNPLQGDIVHVDFLTVNLKEKITSMITVLIEGEEAVTKRGGVLQTGAKEIEVSCLPQDLPESIMCDVSSFNIGDRIIVSDLNMPPGVQILDSPETLILSVLAPAKPEELGLTDAEAEETTEDDEDS